MDEYFRYARSNSVSTTQLGAIGEALVATQLILSSQGQLAPFTPFADDDGIDLLVYDKFSKRSQPLQIKSRSKVDDPDAQTVQFDVRISTYSEEGNGHLIAVLMHGMSIECAWLIPMSELKQVARKAPGKFVVVASAKPSSNDRYSQFRHFDFDDLADALILSLSV